MNKILSLLLSAVAFSSAAFAAQSDSDMLNRANRGDAEAQRIMGKRLFYGLNGTPIKRKIAIQWFKKAAEQGDAQALCILGELYEKGMNVKQNVEKAQEYYKKAASAGSLKAKKKLASAEASPKQEDKSANATESEADEEKKLAAGDAAPQKVGSSAEERAVVSAAAPKQEDKRAKAKAAESAADEEKKLTEADTVPQRVGSPAEEKAVASTAVPKQEDKSAIEENAEEEEEEEDIVLLRGEPGKKALPLPYGYIRLSGKCRFSDERKSAVIIEDGRKCHVSAIRLMEKETAGCARVQATDSVLVEIAQKWKAVADYVEKYDFCSDPLLLCYINAAVRWGNDEYAKQLIVEDGYIEGMTNKYLFENAKVTETLKENIRKLQGMEN